MKEHMTLNERLKIEQMLNAKHNFADIAREIGKNRSTISREISKHTTEVKKTPYGRIFNDCKKRMNCPAMENCGNIYCRRVSCTNCSKGCGSRKCNQYERDICLKLEKVPYVCNGCLEFNKCTLTKVLYDGAKAEVEYQKELKESREGFAITKVEAEKIQSNLKPLIQQGHSVYGALESSKEEIPYTPKTLYTYINAGVFPEIKNIDLPRKVKYKPRKKKTDFTYKSERKCREYRHKEDFDIFMKENPGTAVTEMDTVEGPRDEKKCILTLQFQASSVQIGFLRQSNDSASVSAIFRKLQHSLGREDYMKLFPVVLTDNGSEFTDPETIEIAEDGEILSRVFYCHPMASWEKGDCENNHALMRRIIPKGRSFAFLTQEKVDLMMNNINSYPRAQYHGKSAYEMFVFLYGQELANKLGLKEVPKDQVVLKPELI